MSWRRTVTALGITLGVAAALLTLAGCEASRGAEGPVGPAGPAGPPGPQGPTGDAASARQSYVGSEECAGCHQEIYARFSLSGHPHQLTRISDGRAPVLPYDRLTGGLAQPPDGHEWSDISYVVGGYGWKALFLDQDGYIITGDATVPTQFNLANADLGAGAEWVAFEPGEQLVYDCGGCHTTGYNPDGNQDGMVGIVGSWALPGVQCEECHGPGSGHATDPYGLRLVVDRSSQLCGDCHARSNPALVEAEGGFVGHYQQYSELFNSKHFALGCVTCHDPHASALYSDEELNPNRGLRQSCDSCHWQQVYQKNRWHGGVDCVDCHMAPLGKSAVGEPETYRGDIRSHLFSINPDAGAPQFGPDGAFAMPYVTLPYACLQCHNDEAAALQPIEALEAMADGYHTPPLPTPTTEPAPEPEATPES
jgi:hypothetical protein